MTLPFLLFALLIALLFGAVYHLLRGGGIWRLMFYLFLSVVGFAVGHFAGRWIGWILLPLGAFDLGAASLGSLALLVAGDWLSRIEAKPESKV